MAVWTEQERAALGKRLQALIASGMPLEAITAGHPYPGQRYRHGWIPVAGFNPKAYRQRGSTRHERGLELGHRGESGVTRIGSVQRHSSGRGFTATHSYGGKTSTSHHRTEGEARSAIIRGHEQHTEAGSPRQAATRKFVKESGINDWERTKPWERPEADFAAGKVPGFQMPTGAARGFSARWEGDHINLNPATFDGSTPASRRSLFYHEAGHGVAGEVSTTLKDVGPLLEPFKHGSGYVSPFGGVKGEHGHADLPGEILADAYAALMDGTAGRYRQPGTDKLFSTVQDAARRLGYPTGDRHANPGPPTHEDWRQEDDMLVRRPGGDIVQVKQEGRGKYRWSVFTGSGRSNQGTATTRKAAQAAVNAAHARIVDSQAKVSA